MKVNQSAFDVGQLSERLYQGYFAHLAALSVAADPRAEQLAPPPLPGHIVPIGTVKRKDGSTHTFHFTYYLRYAQKEAIVASELERIWLAGSLIRIGDTLAQHQYFDRAPELELVRHLRNGVAHGNRFRIDNPGNLVKYPAHNRDAWVKSDMQEVFEITPCLQNQPVLFDFMGAGDVLDLLMSVGIYLLRMGNGDTLRP